MTATGALLDSTFSRPAEQAAIPKKINAAPLHITS
jgi:hypothetical protein